MGDGICTGGVCLIPLDGGEGGQWSRLGSGSDQPGFGIQFAQGVCDKLATGKAESVLVTNRCEQKTASTPPCGAWSSTGGSGTTVLDAGGGGNTFDAGTGNDAGGKIDAGATDDGGSGSSDSSTTRPDVPVGEGGTAIDAGTGSDDAGTGGPPDARVFDVPFIDGPCLGDNCGPPPNCQPPPAPVDGGMCNGIPSQPPSNPGTPCQWDAPGQIATKGSGFCGNLLNLMMLNAPGMPGPIPIPQVPEGQCGSNPGWQFISSTSIVDLCPTSCAPVSSAGATVQFIYGCPSMGAPPDGGMGPKDGGGSLPDGSGMADGPPPPPDASIDADAGLSPMVPVLGGVFQMGCAATDMACNADENPLHMVTLSDYSIDETEVTQAAYDQCLRASVCVAPPCPSWQPSTNGNWPVTCVSWDEAASYCAWMGKRLPTEAEWESAARGPVGDIYPWGNTDPDCTVAAFQVCSFSSPQPVRSFIPGQSRYHAFDMAGNVAEWVFDWYSIYEGDATNPTGPPSGNMRIVRGGDYQALSSALRASYRQQMESLTRSDNVGFRCAKPGF
jgi:formylglycine-generating enzyme required for sulfatase activity